MIGLLNGIVAAAGEDWAILDVAGVGYQLSCSARTLRGMGSVGVGARLYVETFLRDDRIQLYGFADRAERDCFRLLMTVQGIGGRAALAILSALAPDALAQAVAAQDRAAIARANGVGPRLAQRVVAELKDRLGEIAPAAVAPRVDDGGAAADAVAALVNLGYGRTEAFGAVASAGRQAGAGADLAVLIRGALKELAQ